VGSPSPPPSSTPSRSARTPTSGLVSSNVIPTPADWKPKPPASKPSARSKPAKTTAPKYRRPSTPTAPGKAVGQRRSSRARPTAPIPHRRSPPAWGPAENSPSPTGTRPAPRAGNAEPEPPPLITGPRRLGRLRHACSSPPPVHCIFMQSDDPGRVPPEVGHHTPFDFHVPRARASRPTLIGFVRGSLGLAERVSGWCAIAQIDAGAMAPRPRLRLKGR